MNKYIIYLVIDERNQHLFDCNNVIVFSTK